MTLIRSRGEQYAGSVELVVEVCCNCGVMFAMPARLQRVALADHDRSFYCPNGHGQHYTGPTEAQRLAERLERARDYASVVGAERDQAKAAAKAQKGRATRFKNERDKDRKRVAAGVCLCCNRTFQNLARHMEGQHPGFTRVADDDT